MIRQPHPAKTCVASTPSETARHLHSEAAGVHARTAVGVAVLPLDAPVEVGLIVGVPLKRGAQARRVHRSDEHGNPIPHPSHAQRSEPKTKRRNRQEI